jgi:phosphatidate cytidylyltransferase
MMMTAPDPALYWILAILFSALVIGSIARFVALRNADESKRRKRLASLRTWWMLAIFMSAGLLAGKIGICILLGTASCIGWHEFTRMSSARPEDRVAIIAGYGLIIVNYLAIMAGALTLFVGLLPLGAMFVFAVVLLVKDEPQGYIRSAGGLMWGILFLGYGVSHAALLMIHPAFTTGPLGAAGWFLFLVVLTESNDIFQAIVGRRFGSHKKHRISPVISPNKTWEGFFGGMLITVILAVIIAPWLTTLSQQTGHLSMPAPLQYLVPPIMAALLIAIAGFFGDINMSAIKRDSGVKDSSNLLPGMGGVIDRIDSLTMTAPVYVYFLNWWLL